MGCLPFLLFTSLLSIYHIDAIKIQGNNALDEPSIMETLGFSPPCSINEDAIHEGIVNALSFFRDHGFLDAHISHSLQDGTLVLMISEGTPYRIGDIRFSGNSFIKEEVALRTLALRKGSLFSQRAFEKGIEELVAFYGNRGFPFTSISPVSFTPEGTAIHIQIEVEEGPRLRWGTTLVKGNSITKSSVIQKQMRIPTGEYFSESALHSAYLWLGKLPFVEAEGNGALIKGERTGTVDLLVSVKELRSNRINGILGYLPPEDNKKGGTIGLINIELMNLFGTARALHVIWEKQLPPYTKLDVAYTEPWVLGTRAATELTFFHLLEDTLYTISRLAAEVKTDIALSLSLSFVAAWEKFTPASIDLPPATKAAAGTRFEIDVLDYPINPRKGIHYSFYTEYGKKGAISIMKFTLEMLNVIPLRSNQSAVVLITGKASRTNTPPLPEYEQFTLGGYKSLRGYRDRQFRATQIISVTPEYRFLVGKKSRITLFYDAALFQTATYPDNVTSDNFRFGYGLGVAFPATIGVLSIEYALGEERAFLKGKIHLGLDTTF